MLLTNQIAGFCEIKYLKKEVNYEIFFLPADKHQHFLEDDGITLGVHSQACPKYPI